MKSSKLDLDEFISVRFLIYFFGVSYPALMFD